MELYARIFILYLLCVARAFEVPQEETAELRARPLAHVEDLSRISLSAQEKIDGQSTENPRDKRALNLLLSGLAQIFGYTVTPIQYASLSNPNVTGPDATTSNPSRTVDLRQQTASSRPTNTTVPKQQETIRFTGVLNFGNNTDIVGQLQRYEQIFHSQNNTMTSPSASMLPAVDPETDSSTKPPLLAPFFVKIPLPIAPDLIPLDEITMPGAENLGLSYPSPALSTASGGNENTETPVRKEQETAYRNNEDAERYTVQEKDTYDEKNVKKPVNKYNHQLYVDEPRNKQQKNRHDERQRKQEELINFAIKKLKQQEEEKNRDKAVHYSEKEMNERYRNRGEIADRNRGHASKYESTEEREPVHRDEEDEGSAERYAGQENLPNEASRQQSKKNEKEESEDYSNYEDDSNKQFKGYKQPEDKYVEIGYNQQQLPIGDYLIHKGNPEVIRDSYGEVLDNKKLEDDRIAGYISMFKHPYVQADAYDSQRVHNSEEASREKNEKETSAEDDGYDEHLIRLQKLREEYALPENKYEEYELNDENEADRNDRGSERIQNNAPARKPNTGRGKEDDRARRPTGSNRDAVAGLENAKSRKEVDFTGYVPLVVPVRYIDANDKVQQATTRQLSYKEVNKLPDSRFSEDNNAGPAQTVLREELIPQIGLPERPRQLHEGEHKELQVWPPPFDYAFDNTEPANNVVPPNSQNYAPNYYQHVVKGIAAQDANDKSSEQPSGYLVVVGNPTYPYRYPHNIYYFSNEANSRDQVPHAEVTRPQESPRVHVAQQSASQQIVHARPNVTRVYNVNETNSPRDYYYQEIPASVLDHYRYTFGERATQAEEPFDIDIRSHIPNTENWSNRIYRPHSPSNAAEQSPRPVFVPLQNIVSSNQNAQSSRASEISRNSRLLRRRKSLRAKKNDEEAHRKDDEKTHRRNDEEAHRKDDEEAKIPQSALTSKPFDDPQSAHDFFGFSKDDYNFDGESNDATKVAEENGKTVEESDALVALEPAAYHYDDESIVEQTDEPENNTEKAKVREYRNKVATLRVSERRQLKPNGPIHYVDFIRNI
ncbi:PREDICTED: uncharacterized protein DDB_G0290301-like [Wasmannia auropunctata]|uniref:uncharacterized protein DDB_G0290301-like n=1 Tax=Wasmannia auropunctata TaxID=64793 RepID=UPI0005F04E9B|nr:PREDICTED: uncharacterized protein DDB_G0290301-like [Wasmannia auropunctata]